MSDFVIAINFKTYESASGIEAVQLAKVCDEVAKEHTSNIIVCVQASDIHQVSQNISIPVFSQHIDGVEFGAHTGKILADSVRENGGVGTLLNHSEDQYENETLLVAHDKAKKEGLVTIICADTIEKAVSVAKLSPDYVAYEPPELIGGDVSVTTRPQVIEEVVEKVKTINPSVKLLVGAGVKTKEDVVIAKQLGCDGVLLASGITKSTNPKSALAELIEGMK